MIIELPEPDGAIEKSEGFNGIGQEEFTYIDAYSAATVRRLIAAEVEQFQRERQAFKDAAEFAVKERDALRVEVEKLKAEVFDVTSMYNRCVDDVHELRTELAELRVKRVALSDEQIASMGAGNNYPGTLPGMIRFARAIERAHGIGEAL